MLQSIAVRVYKQMYTACIWRSDHTYLQKFTFFCYCLMFEVVNIASIISKIFTYLFWLVKTIWHIKACCNSSIFFLFFSGSTLKFPPWICQPYVRPPVKPPSIEEVKYSVLCLINVNSQWLYFWMSGALLEVSNF